MTCDGKGLFGLGGLGFVMAGEYVLLGFRNSYFQEFQKRIKLFKARDDVTMFYA
jgi:hypothetical protein